MEGQVSTRFLFGPAIRRRIKALVAEGKTLKIAVAYWGQDALDILGLTPTRGKLQVLCELSKGLSSPDVMRKFEHRARHVARLHAKVYWTPGEAVVASANASGNGLGLESFGERGLIEAALSTNDPHDLDQIEKWFDDLWASALRVTEHDLKLAESARARSPQVLVRLGKPIRARLPTLLTCLRKDPESFKRQRIYLCLYAEGLSKEAWSAYRAATKKYKVERLSRSIDYSVRVGPSGCYENWHVPKGAVYVDHLLGARSVTVNKVSQGAVTIDFKYLDGDKGAITLCDDVTIQDFPYRLPKTEKDRIRRRAKKLMASKKAIGDRNAKIIKRYDARKILTGGR
jgi:hypothetical protein